MLILFIFLGTTKKYLLAFQVFLNDFAQKVAKISPTAVENTIVN